MADLPETVSLPFPLVDAVLEFLLMRSSSLSRHLAQEINNAVLPQLKQEPQAAEEPPLFMSLNGGRANG